MSGEVARCRCSPTSNHQGQHRNARQDAPFRVDPRNRTPPPPPRDQRHPAARRRSVRRPVADFTAGRRRPDDGPGRRGDRRRPSTRSPGSRRISSSPGCWSRRCAASAPGVWSRACARRAARCCCSARSRSCSTCRSRTAASRRTGRAGCSASGWAGSRPGSSAASAARSRATTTLIVAMLLITDVSTREVAVVLAWAGKHACAAWSPARPARWRVMRAAFPEKDDRDDRRRREPEEDVERRRSDRRPRSTPARSRRDEERTPTWTSDEQGRRAARGTPPSWRRSRRRWRRRTARACASARRAASPRSGRSRARRDGGRRRRGGRGRVLRARSARRPSRRGGRRGRGAGDRRAAAPAGAAADAPIIVEPASIARFRQQEAADAAAAAELSAEEAARLRDEKRGFIKLSEGDFALPGTDLLEYIPPANHDTDKQPLYDMAERLEQAMSNYGVRGKVKEIHMGPVVTMYEFAPAPGTRTNKIVNLDRRSRAGARSAARPHRRADPGQGRRRHRGAEQDAREGLPQGDPRRRRVPQGDVEAADRARQGHRGRAVRRRPGEHAAPARRRHDRLGQVGRASTR